MRSDIVKIPASNRELWFEARRGIFTSSNLSRLMTNPKKPALISAGAKTYAEETLAEDLAGYSPEFSNDATEHGNEYEALAVAALCLEFGIEAEYDGEDQCLFLSDSLPFGGTPDGLVYDQSVCIEVKCPYAPKKHLQHLLLEGELALKSFNSAYYWQCIGNMIVTETDRCLFASYNSRFPDSSSLKVIEIKLTDEARERAIDRIKAASDYLSLLRKKLGGKK